MKEIGRWATIDLGEGMESVTPKIFMNVMGWEKEKVDDLLAKAHSQLQDRNSHCYCPIGVVYARKPEEGA